MLGLANKDELYERLSIDEHRDWAEYFKITWFTPRGIRFGLAVSSAATANSLGGSKDKKPLTPEDFHMPPAKQAAKPEDPSKGFKMLNAASRDK